MPASVSRSLSKASASTHSIGSHGSCFSSGFSSRQNVTLRSGKEWWLFAIAKALAHASDGRRGFQSASTEKSLSSTDSKMLEYKQKYEELAKLKKILSMVKGHYEEAKRYDVFRRYIRLKRAIKHTIIYVNLEVLPDMCHALGGAGSMIVAATTGNRKPPITNIPECPKAELSNRIHTLTKRISFIRNQIEELSERYEASKQYMVFQRYRLMKGMIKGILTDCIDLQNNQ
ncbi:uncharacterized protein [Watersipora subatra]|uniref:uncharacterized protein n=1 Tax=Watersipora subatra TaxID=2589382 RepID=UPI00355C7184